MINLRCPICASVHFDEVREFNSKEEIYKVVGCLDCSHLFTLVTSDVDEDLLYTDAKYHVVDNRGSIFDKIIGNESRNVLKTLRRLGRLAPASILDFGCGKGKFLSVAQQYGWTTMGVETSLPRAAFAKEKYSLNVNTETFSSGMLADSPFDVITLFHVLEHFTSPMSIMTGLVKENLKNNGIIVVEVPNISSWQATIAKDQWEHLDRPRHLSHFSLPLLKELLEKLGCKVVRTEYFSIRVGVLGMLRALIGKLGYKDDITASLKNHKSFRLLLAVLLLAPLAVILEILAVFFKKGGILRVYAINRS